MNPGASRDASVFRDQVSRLQRDANELKNGDVVIDGERRLMVDGSRIRVDGDGYLYTTDAAGVDHPLTIGSIPGLADALKIRSFTVAKLPDPTDTEQLPILVTNASGGAVLAFTEGTHWRRVTDRAIVS